MDLLQKFLFEGLPVRGMLVRLGASWRELLARRASVSDGGHAFAPPVRALLGEMAAAGVLMQGNLKFNGALILQMQGDGPVKLAVAETQPDLSFRVTAKVVGDVAADPAPGAAVGTAVVTAASFCEEHAERAPRATTMHTSRSANIPQFYDRSAPKVAPPAQ